MIKFRLILWMPSLISLLTFYLVLPELFDYTHSFDPQPFLPQLLWNQMILEISTSNELQILDPAEFKPWSQGKTFGCCKEFSSQAWWCMSVISALGRSRQKACCEFQASFSCIVNSKTA